MQPVFWKSLSAVLVLCLLVQQFSWRRSTSEHTVNDNTFATISTSSRSSKAWSYDWKRDSNNHGLSTAQCDAAFPDLYSEIDRAASHWKVRKITPQDIFLPKANDGGVRVLIVDQQLRIIRAKGLARNDFRQRIFGVLQQLQRAITAAEHTGETFPNTEFTIIVDDIPVLGSATEEPGAVMAFSRAAANPRHDNIWVIPDFHFYGAPPETESWQWTQTKAREHDSSIQDKIPRVVWRGVMWTNRAIREPLLSVTSGQQWANVKAMDWANPQERMSMDEFCKYRYTVNTEGRSWSARLSGLLNCDSLLMVHDVEWIAHYYHLLNTGVNCVRVQRNFTDLEQKVAYYNIHIAEAQRIADMARSTFRERYTTPAATACYWRKLMRSWALVSFEPETMDAMGTQHSWHSTSGLRGISFEEFIVHDNTRDFPYLERKNHKPPGKLNSSGNVKQKKIPGAATHG